MTNKKAAVKPAKEPKPKVSKETVKEPTNFPGTTVAEAIAAGKKVDGDSGNPPTGDVPPPVKEEKKKKAHKKSGDDVPEFKDLVTYIPENGADPVDAVVLDVHNDNTVSLLFEDKSEKRIVQKGNKPGHWHYKE